MKAPRPVTIDFETLPIEDRPAYPPPAVGVSIKYPGKKSQYYGWGHPEGNNSTWPEAKAALIQAYKHKDGLLFQNAKFDIDVAEVEFGLPVPPWQQIHDTMLLLFLDDPHQRELGLKPSAERLLDWAPEERDLVIDWLLARQPLMNQGVKLTAAKGGKNPYAGAFVAFAPGTVTGPYAIGDTDRTAALFDLLWSSVKKRGMLGAYERELKLLPILLGMERVGVAIATKRLAVDIATHRRWFDQIGKWIIKRIKAPADLNLNSGPQLVKALIKAGLANEDGLGVTEGGQVATSNEALHDAVSDAQLLTMLRHRAALKTCLGTFMEPWARMSGPTGRIYATWNQVKAPKGDTSAGTRTGRLSATWFMNMPKEFTPLWRHQVDDPKKAKALPICPLKGLPDLPMCRGYIIPFAGHVFCDRDYSQQEPRILAHFDGGSLMIKYNDEPWIDFHDFAKAELAKVGLFYERKPVKNTNLGLIYGMGVGKLAAKNDMTVAEAKTLKDAILLLYPGLKEMYKDMRQRADNNMPIRTWGGREYYCEAPILFKGRWLKFDYKLVNILIQGSAADCTKEAIIRLDAEIVKHGKRDIWFIVLNVHDQLVMSVPRSDLRQAMEIQRQVMEGIEFDVPMLTEGDWTADNWAAMTTYDKKGEVMYDGK